MRIAVHDYRSTEWTGTLDIDDQTGAFRFLDGSAALEEWARSVAQGYSSRRSKCTHTYCDVGTWINLPWHAEFRRQLDLALVRIGLCTEVLAAFVRNHPNFAEHPWRKARGGEGVPPDDRGAPVRFRILESQAPERSACRPVGVAAQVADGAVLRFSPDRLFPPLCSRSLEELAPEDFQTPGGPEASEFGIWRPGPLLEGRLPGEGTVLDFMALSWIGLPIRGEEEPDDDL